MNYINNLFKSFILIFFVLGVTSCTHDHNEEDGHTHDETDQTHTADHEEGLHLTKEQIRTIGLQFGEMTNLKINDFVKATGTLGLPPNAFSVVSPKAAGIITGNKKYIEGNSIRKGEVIAYLENPTFIVTQQEYLETTAALKLKKLEVERHQALVNANAGTTKKLQQAQAEAEMLNAKSTGISKQLNYIGIRTENLTTENIKQRVAIIAPMSGHISSINMHNGMYAEATSSLMDIISDEHLHLELDIFEKDIAQIKEGQQISYSIPALGNKIYKGEVSVIGKEFDSETKTIRVHGHLEEDRPMFIKDFFINAKIWLSEETTTALPEKSIIKEGGSSFVFVGKNDPDAEEIFFEKVMVLPGETANGFTSIQLIDEIPEGMVIVTQGTYYVYAQSMAGELKHEH